MVASTVGRTIDGHGRMSRDGSWAIALWFTGTVLVLFASSRTEIESRNRQMRKAIDHGAAEWRCDPETGAKELFWLTDEGDGE